MKQDEAANKQIIYMNMDDSGVLIKGKIDDPIFVYGGIIFLSKDEKDNFLRQYSALVNLIKAKYCVELKQDNSINSDFCLTHSKQNCKYNCPELKSSLI